MQKNKQNTLQSVPDNAPIVTSAWISAHAGSGKTHALVSRIVKLLLLGVPAERITAITYTRAAAAEMRERVVRQLRELMLATDAICRERCAALLGRAPSAQEFTRARGLFIQLLNSPSGGVELTTIHGFCQQLLRAFPLEANVPPYFTVLDETEAQLLIHRASQRLFDADEDTEIIKALGFLAERMAEETFHTRAKMLLSKRQLWQQLFQHHSRATLRSALFALHGLDVVTTQETLLNALCALPDDHDAAIIRGALPGLYAHKNKGEQKLAAVLEAWLLADASARHAMHEEFLQLFLTKDDAKPRDRILNHKDYPQGSALRTVVERLLSVALCYVDRCRALACAEETYASAIVAHALLEHYEQLKSTHAALDYEDLITHTIRLLTVRDMTAWVMTKLDNRIDHLLIDEAQDTSAGQWHIVRALIEELVVSADGIGSANLPRSLFVVGDEKQSIFSFQGADPALFSQYQQYFAERLGAQSTPFTTEYLTVSRRSAPMIVALVNHVIALPPIASAISAQPAIPAHHVHRSEAAGRVVLYPLLAAEEKSAPMPFTIPQTYQITRSAAQQVAEAIAEQVSAWMRDKRILRSEKRAITAGDILILVRQRQRLSHCLIRALQRRNIAVAGLDRLNLNEHLAVQDLLALMRWIQFLNDDLALAQVLRSPLIGISEEELCALAHARDEASLWQRVEPSPHGVLLSKWRKMTEYPAYDFLTEILEVYGKRRNFAQRFGEEVHEVLDELKSEAAHEITQGIAQFEDQIRTREKVIKREQESGDMVRVMTVHGAKGLEAPIVILADTTGMPDLRKEQVFTCADAQGRTYPLVQFSAHSKGAPLLRAARDARLQAVRAEYQRLLYVAITRAAEELHVFGAGKNAPPESWYASLRDAMMLMPHATHDNGTIVASDTYSSSPLMIPTPQSSLLHLPDWAHQPAAVSTGTTLLTPSNLVVVEPVAASRFVRQNSKERGVRIHAVLQALHDSSSATDIRDLVDFYAAEWDENSKAEIAREITALHEKERWIWAESSRAEVSVAGVISHQGTSRSVAGQVDRIVVGEKALWILDFKTGQAAMGAEETPLAYVLQLKTYAALLEQTYNNQPIRCGIVWTSIPMMVDITAQVQQASW